MGFTHRLLRMNTAIKQEGVDFTWNLQTAIVTTHSFQKKRRKMKNFFSQGCERHD